MDTKIPKHIIASVKDTVGYSEAENKESFMVGSSVSFSRAEEYYKPIIKQLEANAKMYCDAYGQASSDIRTISKILGNYSE